MIEYLDRLDNIQAGQLCGFFVDWPDPPTPETHLRLLEGSDAVVLAVSYPEEQVVGFITALSDGVLSAYIPLLEVLPEHQNKGIGSELSRRMLAKLEHLYMVDLLCDADKQHFYSRFGMQPAAAMMVRNYVRQSGA